MYVSIRVCSWHTSVPYASGMDHSHIHTHELLINELINNWDVHTGCVCSHKIKTRTNMYLCQYSLIQRTCRPNLPYYSVHGNHIRVYTYISLE